MGVELPGAREVPRRLVMVQFIDPSLRRAAAGRGEGVIC